LLLRIDAGRKKKEPVIHTHPIPLDSMASLLLLAAWHTLAQKRYEIDKTTDSEKDFHSGDSSSMSDKEGDVDPDSGLDGELDELDNNS
jgi:hypothetical protein